MTTIDIQTTDSRKQFWKVLIRDFSVEYKTITYFGCEDEGTSFDVLTAESYGYTVNYDGFPSEWDYCVRKTMFSTRQSSFIKSIDQLEVIDGKSDSDRGIMEMNFALVKELGISGVEIWKRRITRFARGIWKRGILLKKPLLVRCLRKRNSM